MLAAQPGRRLGRPVRPRPRRGQPAARRGPARRAVPRPGRAAGSVTRQVRALLAGERLLPGRAAGARPLRLAHRPGPACRSTLAALGPGARSGSPASWPTAGTRSCCRCPGCPRGIALLDDGRGAGPGAPRPRIVTLPAGRRRARRRPGPAAGLVVGRLLPDQHGPAVPAARCAARARRRRRRGASREPDAQAAESRPARGSCSTSCCSPSPRTSIGGAPRAPTFRRWCSRPAVRWTSWSLTLAAFRP